VAGPGSRQRALDVVERRVARHRRAMLTWSVPVDLVRATQRPLFAPRLERTVQIDERAPEQTTAGGRRSVDGPLPPGRAGVDVGVAPGGQVDR
jgi:hypothetical protein